METGQYPSKRRKLDWGRQLRRSMEFDDHPFGIPACRALEYARITSRFVSSMRASFILVSHFTPWVLAPFLRFANAARFRRCWLWRKRQSIWRGKCM